MRKPWWFIPTSLGSRKLKVLAGALLVAGGASRTSGQDYCINCHLQEQYEYNDNYPGCGEGLGYDCDHFVQVYACEYGSLSVDTWTCTEEDDSGYDWCDGQYVHCHPHT